GRNGGPPGDLYIEIVIKPHATFTRKSDDLHTELSVSLFDMLLSRKIQVPSFKGPKRISLPVGLQPGEKVKLSGLGMPNYENPGKFGDLHVTVKVQMPKRLTAEQYRLLEEVERLGKG
ncbi:MAG: J domain-containing protein, partial [Bacteroidota bacterium]